MSARVRMYGIKNCDTVRKARAWLDARNVEYLFHDFKASGVERAQIETWCREHGWEAVLNRAGTTFRKLEEGARENLTERKAVALMLERPSMIKRPVLEVGGRSIVGFSPELYADALA